MMELPAKFKDLKWHKIKVDLVSTINHKWSWLTIFQPIIKAVTLKTAESYGLEHIKNLNTIFFHLVNKPFNTKILEGSTCQLEIIFTRFKEREISLWREIFIKHISEEAGNRFILKSVSEIEHRESTTLLYQYTTLPSEGELCLNFLTPLAFNPPADRDRTFLGKDQFLKFINQRFYSLFGIEIHYTEGSDKWSLLPYYWHYSEVRHISLSHPGKIKYINGCTGKLYIKGRFKELLPYLILQEELHTGTKITYGRGYYKLHLEPISFYSTFPDKKEISAVIIDTLNKNDILDHDNINEKELANQLFQELKDNTYNPSPAIAFRGDSNILYEKYTFKDLIIQQYLLRLLEEPLNRVLQPTTIGYKKGISQKDIQELIDRAIKNGYEYIALFELESYYNAIQHESL
ncbi:MAG: CRISPR system precrRNA processing endoribonuclease RAMP protein Cas6, partial [Thermodesulfovibrionales bacterium]